MTKVIGKMSWRFQWLSGFYNGLVKWWLSEVDGWKIDAIKHIDKYDVRITSVKEYDDHVDYTGEILSDVLITQAYIEDGISRYVKKYIIPALAALIGYLIQFTVFILWVNLMSSQIINAFNTLAPVAIGGLAIYGLYRYIRKKT